MTISVRSPKRNFGWISLLGGGMAAAEGMAWGLPGVSYDLRALKTYYPRGMVKVPVGAPREFAGAIVKLLRNGEDRRRLGDEARKLINDEWSWAGQAGRIWESMERAGLTRSRS